MTDSPPPQSHNENDAGQLPPTVPKQQRIEPVGSGQITRRLFHQLDWIEDWMGSKSYGAPRVFDLYTLMAMMIGFALLFGGMKLIEPLLFDAMPTYLWIVTAFCMLIGLAQMFLWGGERPRLASLVAGPVLWILFGCILLMTYSQSITQAGSSQIVRQLQSMLPAGLGILCSSFLGIFTGYVAGGAVAGVFLIADWIRTKMLPNRTSPIEVDSSAIWDDEEPVEDQQKTE